MKLQFEYNVGVSWAGIVMQSWLVNPSSGRRTMVKHWLAELPGCKEEEFASGWLTDVLALAEKQIVEWGFEIPRWQVDNALGGIGAHWVSRQNETGEWVREDVQLLCLM